MTAPPQIFEKIVASGKKIRPEIIELRRHLHQFPELGHEEVATTRLLKNRLKKMGLRIFDALDTGLWAQLDTGRPGPTVAVRTDIDALPIPEQTNLPYQSKNKGRMHACGHDAHMAVAMGTAQLLTAHKADLCGTVKFFFQPAEEIPPGGARLLIKAGALRNPKVDAIIALHVDPGVPCGHIGTRDGVSMAATFDFDITVKGKSSHAALPHLSVDAITVAAEIISGLQQVVSRMIDPIEPAVITFGTIIGGNVRNAIAGSVSLTGTARSLNSRIAKKLQAAIKRTAVNIGRGFGASVDVTTIASYPPLDSNPRVNEFITSSYKTIYPRGKVHKTPLVMGGEDFACYLEKVPGAMFRLGVRNAGIGADKSWHDPAFKIDESALEVGYNTMAATVINLLYNWRGRK